MKAFLLNTFLILSAFTLLLVNQVQGQGKERDCGESCFTSEIITVNELDNGCLQYTIRVTAGSDCANALSHFSVDVPCGEVSDVSNSRGWKIGYGYDPVSDLNGFKIDDIAGFGENSGSFDISFTVCPQADCDAASLACWSPRVAYKASTCVYFEELAVQCSKLEAAIAATDITCAGAGNGSVVVEIIDGTEPFVYSWPHDQALQSAEAHGLSAGEYSVVVTDGNGETVELSAMVNEPQAIQTNATITDASCSSNEDGSISVNATGGAGGLTYKWSHGPEGNELNNVAPGIYILTITDASECAVTKAYSVGVENEIVITGEVSQTGCSTEVGAIDISVSGGTGGYTYVWSNEATTQDITGLGEGLYTVVVTDNSGCSAERNFYLTARNTLRLSATRTNTSCIEDNSGSIDLTVTGGSGDYSYSWSGVDSQDQDISGLAAGYYEVTVSDSEGCSSSLQVVIGTNTVSVTGTVTKPSCNGAGDGSIELTPGADEGNLTYLWSTEDTGSALYNLGPGVYTVLVTNEDGCTKELTYVVSDPIPLSISASVTNNSCEDGDYNIDIAVSGGSGDFTYEWGDTDVMEEDRTGITAGTYTVYVTDQNGCVQEMVVEVNETTANCTDTSDPVNPDEPVDPDNPDDPANPDNPDDPVNPDNPDDPVNPDNPESCTDPYDAELVLVSRDGNCFTYEMTVTYDGNKSYGLSHLAVEVPCGDIRDIYNSGGWKVVEGTDPGTGIDGFKIDDISGFGEGNTAGEFTIEFTICGESEECADQLYAWQPVVGFKYGQCVDLEGMELTSLNTYATVYPNPFTSSVNLNYEMPEDGTVHVEIFSESGVKKADLYHGSLEGGENISWTWVPDASIPDGIYIYRITSESSVDYGKILLKR